MKFLPVVLMLPGLALAAGPFDGTWKTDMKSFKVTGKPDVYLLADGQYRCSSCDPALEVKADGMEHKVTGHAYYDSAIVKVTGPNTDDVVLKKGGKEFAHLTDTVSADGKTLTMHYTNHVGKEVVSGDVTEERLSAGPAGSHPVSGSWQQQGFTGSDIQRTTQYLMSTDGLQMTWNGQTYDAKFDGKEYPVKGDPGNTTVSLKKVDDTTVEETDHRQGKVVDQIRMAVAPDGKSMNVTDQDLAHGQTTSFKLEKQ